MKLNQAIYQLELMFTKITKRSKLQASIKVAIRFGENGSINILANNRTKQVLRLPIWYQTKEINLT